MKKGKRQSKILEIIGKHDVYSQDELITLLNKNGIVATQSTISRDIKEMKIMKIPALNGKWKYSATLEEKKQRVNFRKIINETVLMLKISKNLIVVHTHVGCANAAAAAIDAMNFSEVIGTIAGDDTILIVLATDESAESVSQELMKIIVEN